MKNLWNLVISEKGHELIHLSDLAFRKGDLSQKVKRREDTD